MTTHLWHNISMIMTFNYITAIWASLWAGKRAERKIKNDMETSEKNTINWCISWEHANGFNIEMAIGIVFGVMYSFRFYFAAHSMVIDALEILRCVQDAAFRFCFHSVSIQKSIYLRQTMFSSFVFVPQLRNVEGAMKRRKKIVSFWHSKQPYIRFMWIYEEDGFMYVHNAKFKSDLCRNKYRYG